VIQMRLMEDPVALRFHLAGQHDLTISHLAALRDDDLDDEHKRATVRDTKAGVLNHGHDAA